MAKIDLKHLEEELANIDSPERQTLEKNIAKTKPHELVKWMQQTEEEKFYETHCEYLLRTIKKEQYMRNLKELKRVKNRRKLNCSGINCMFNPESGIKHNTPIMCDHLEALMPIMSRKQVRDLLTKSLDF